MTRVLERQGVERDAPEAATSPLASFAQQPRRRDSGSCPLSTTTNDCKGWHLSGTGEQMGDTFVSGNPWPVPLNGDAPKVTPATMEMTDCPETQCVRQ